MSLLYSIEERSSSAKGIQRNRSKKTLIILEIDFPQMMKLAKSQEKQNKALAKKFKIEDTQQFSS